MAGNRRILGKRPRHGPHVPIACPRSPGFAIAKSIVQKHGAFAKRAKPRSGSRGPSEWKSDMNINTVDFIGMVVSDGATSGAATASEKRAKVDTLIQAAQKARRAEQNKFVSSVEPAVVSIPTDLRTAVVLEICMACLVWSLGLGAFIRCRN